ncbi:MAG: two-component regulator propeller domain-containing protein [Bacteroidota bacterium]
MNRIIPCLFLLLLMVAACERQPEPTQTKTINPKVVEAKGYVVPKDSLAEPLTVPSGKPKTVKAGNPKIIPTNTNIQPAGIPKVVVAGNPKVIILGQDGFLLPKTVPAIDRSFAAGIPDVVIAKDPYVKEINPQNFSSFGKLQGLKHGNINCMLQDKKGNIWFGTDGGVSKYDGKWFIHYTEKEGLGDNYIRSILEDKTGNLWFGTLGNGVSRLSRDGKRFTHFTTTEGLIDNSVKCMLEDRSGNIWFGTNGGVSKYDGKNFTQYTEKVGLKNNELDCILEDRSGNIWFSTWDSGVCRLSPDGKSFTNYTVKEGLSSNAVHCMLEDSSGNIWFGMFVSGVSRLSPDKKSFTNYTRKDGLGSNHVTSGLQDQNGNLWFGTNGGGVSRVSRDGKIFTHFTDKEGLSNNFVTCILEDSSGTLWFGRKAGGVSKHDGKLFTHYTVKEGLANIIVWSILEDRHGSLWFGTETGVSRLNPDATSFTNFTSKEGLSDKSIYYILEDKSGNLWFATWGDGVVQLSRDGKRFTHYTNKEGLSDNFIKCILEDKSGNLWFCAYNGVSRLSQDGKWFTQYTVKEGLSDNYIRTILEDKTGNIWFGTDSRGVTKLNPDRRTFTHYTVKQGLSNTSAHNLLEDRYGDIWIGSYLGGISKLSKDGKQFTYYTEKTGLTNDVVLSSMEDRKGNLWFGTRFGISKIPSSSLKGEREIVFKNYNYDDGFTGIGVFEGALYEDRKGTIWIGSNNGLTAYHPEGDRTDTIGPYIQLTNLELFNENIPWPDLEKNKDTTLILGNGVKVGDFHFDSLSDWYFLPLNLSLAYDNNFLTFNFIGITQKQPKKVKYQYKLEGFDKNWSVLTNRNEAPYGNLPHGNFTFKVKAMNGDGYWSNEFNYTFTIRPPWYKTGWFRAFSLLLILFSLFMMHHWRTAALRRRQKQLEKIVAARTSEVVHQKEEIEVQKEEVECQKEALETTLDKLKRTQSQLIQSEKMASLGMLTAGIAHEINNPVNFINSGAISLEKDYEDMHKIIKSLGQLPPETQKLADQLGLDELLKIIPQTIEDIKTGVQRTSAIVRGLRNFTRMDASELREADLHEGIDSTLLLLSHKLKDRIRIVKAYDKQIGSIKCYPGPLNQVFMNLLNNAIDALEQKVKEGLSGTGATGTQTLVYTPQIVITTKMSEENGRKQVKIEISDNGTGIPGEIRDKLFDPFFTTKEVGKGTGLGLAICHGIIEKHGGRITIDSSVNEGSTFTITIPNA